MKSPQDRIRLIQDTRQQRGLDQGKGRRIVAPPTPGRMPDASIEARHLLPCHHRGQAIDKTSCRSCNGTVSLRVFDCALHRRCTMVSRGDAGDRICATCCDRRIEPESVPFASFANRHAGQVGYVLGRGETTFDYRDLLNVDGPVFMINDSVSAEQYVPHDDVYFFALDSDHNHWLRQTDEHPPIRSLPVLMEGDWGLPGFPRRVRGARRVCWYLNPMNFTDRWLALDQTREQLAASRMLYRGRGTIQPLIHFAWFAGVNHLRLIGCDGINDPSKPYDERLPNLSGRQPGMIYDGIRRRQDEVIAKLGMTAEYVGTPAARPRATVPPKPLVTLITPTRDAPEAFALCETWMERQDFAGAVQWIVVDDGDQPITCTQGQLYIRRQPTADDPDHTLGLNLLEAIPNVQADRVIIIEHDDYYPQDYLRRMMDLLAQADLVGTSNDRYYNVRDRRWRRCRNTAHSSLFATGMRRSVLDHLARVCREWQTFIDITLWRSWDGPKLLIDRDTPEAPQAVGIKCLPGRKSLTTLNGRWSAQAAGVTDGEPDPSGDVLRQWIPADYQKYLPFAGAGISREI